MAILKPELKSKYQKFEGGYQCYPEDSANYNTRHELVGTNMGVGALTYEDHLGRAVTKEDMQNMPKDVPGKIMQKYWDIVQGDLLHSQAVAEFLLDWFWASGYTGIRWFQGVLKIRLQIPIKQDYKFETWEAEEVNAYQPQSEVFAVLKDERIKYTDYIIKSSIARYLYKCREKQYRPTARDIYNNTLQKFETGWKTRINSYSYENYS